MSVETKAGFTLVEVMVVAIIVAILMAVAVPILMGSKNRAMVTEAQTGMGVIRQAMQLHKTEYSVYPTTDQGKNMSQATRLTVRPGDLDGRFFKSDGYVLTMVTASNFTITARGYTNGSETLSVTLDQSGGWGGVP